MGMKKEGSRIVILGFYSFTGSLWCLTDIFYPYLSLFVKPLWIANIIDVMAVFLFPNVLAMLMLYYIRGKRTRFVIRAVFMIEVSLMLLCFGLQVLGVADLAQQQIIMGVIAFLCIGVSLICVVFDLRKYRDNYLVLLILTILPVLACNVLDGINMFYPFAPHRMLMRYGFSISIFLLILQLVVYANAELAKEAAMKEMEHELEDSRIRVMLSQIQPHFLYNSLVCIKQLTDSNPQMASEALEHFSYYLRRNLDSLSNRKLITFEQEMEHVQDYLFLEKMRFPKKVHVKYELNYYDFSLPPLCVQALIENAIRYGITKKRGGGTLWIKSEEIQGNIVIFIEDDGVGFDPSLLVEDGRSHTGIENVRSRLQMQCNGTLEIRSKQNVGTRVTITIPRKENRHENNRSR